MENSDFFYIQYINILIYIKINQKKPRDVYFQSALGRTGRRTRPAAAWPTGRNKYCRPTQSVSEKEVSERERGTGEGQRKRAKRGGRRRRSFSNKSLQLVPQQGRSGPDHAPGDPSGRRDPRPRYSEIAAHTPSRPPPPPAHRRARVTEFSGPQSAGNARPPARAAFIVRPRATAQRRPRPPLPPARPPLDPFRTNAFYSEPSPSHPARPPP